MKNMVILAVGIGAAVVGGAYLIGAYANSKTSGRAVLHPVANIMATVEMAKNMFGKGSI